MQLRTEILLGTLVITTSTFLVASFLLYPELRNNQALPRVEVILITLGASTVSALIVAWAISSRLRQRLSIIAEQTQHRITNPGSPITLDLKFDEAKQLNQVLNESLKELGSRVEKLSQDRSQMEAMLSGMAEGVLIVNETERLQLANDAARDMLGLDESLAGKHYLEAIRHPEVAKRLAATLAEQTSDATEFSLNRDPSKIIMARITPAFSSGSRGAILVLHDITALRHADQIRRDFVANISHELRTPLTAIRGYVEAILEGPLEPNRTNQFLEIIERHTIRMERLVTDLLQLARLDAKQEPLNLTKCSIEAILSDVTTELSPVFNKKQQQVNTFVTDGLCSITADAGKLHTILRNLLENALRHAPENSAIEIDVTSEDSHIVLRISDRGEGIPETDIERIFERFYQVDRARSKRSGGTGLGLAIVKHLVALHGGKIWAEDRTGGGTVLTASFPPNPPPNILTTP